MSEVVVPAVYAKRLLREAMARASAEGAPTVRRVLRQLERMVAERSVLKAAGVTPRELALAALRQSRLDRAARLAAPGAVALGVIARGVYASLLSPFARIPGIQLLVTAVEEHGRYAKTVLRHAVMRAVG